MNNFNNLTEHIKRLILTDTRVEYVRYATGAYRHIHNSLIQGYNAFIIRFKPEYQEKNFIIILDNSTKNYRLFELKDFIHRFRTDSLINFNNTIQFAHLELSGYKNLLDNLIFKVIDFKKSSELFKYTNVKQSMVGKQFVITKVLTNYVCKETGETQTIAEVYNPEINKSLKFVASDLELVEPNFIQLFKGYSLPKITKIVIGSKVNIINPGRLPLNVKTDYVVSDIRKVSSTTYCQIKSKNYLFMIDQKNLKLL